MGATDSAFDDGFEAILGSDALRLHFQPIVYLPEGHLLGYESLSRGPKGSQYENADILFQSARDRKLVFELEYECQSKLLRSLRRTPDYYLFLNLEPVLLESDDFLKLPVFHSGNSLERKSFVVELTERHHIRDIDAIKNNIRLLRDQGFKIALDDVGSGYSDLDSIVEFQPDFIKISHKIVQDVSLNPVKKKIVTLMLELADVSNAFLVAEGIESFEDYRALRKMGVHFGQGFLLAAPRPEMIYHNRVQLFQELQSSAIE